MDKKIANEETKKNDFKTSTLQRQSTLGQNILQRFRGITKSLTFLHKKTTGLESNLTTMEDTDDEDQDNFLRYEKRMQEN